MFLENKQKITEIDLGWQKSDYVSPSVSSENDDMDKDPAALKFAWFKVDSNIKSSENEEKEKAEAMKVQFALKIINKYGLPYGMEMPKELKNIIKQREQDSKKGGKWDRQRDRLIDRQIEKDMKSERQKENNSPLLNNLSFQLPHIAINTSTNK